MNSRRIGPSIFRTSLQGFPVRWALSALVLLAVMTPRLSAAQGFARDDRVDAATLWMGDYLPLHLGETWTYQNVSVPADTYTESVFENLIYDGAQAVKLGGTYDYTVIGKTGRTITVYAFAESGVLYDLTQNIVLGTFSDGYVFPVCSAAPCDSNLIRDWELIDPSLRSAYGLDAIHGDLVLIVSYDRHYPPNAQNVVAASNLPAGVSPPAGAVISLEWYQRGLGMVATLNVDVEAGGAQRFYKLTATTAVDESQPDGVFIGLRPLMPNPTRGMTSVSYVLALPGRVQLAVHDVSGRLVRTLVDGERRAGTETVAWDGTDDSGRRLGPGVYFVGLTAPGIRHGRKAVLVR